MIKFLPTIDSAFKRVQASKAKSGAVYIGSSSEAFRRKDEVCTTVRADEQSTGNACTQGKCMSERNQPGPGPELEPIVSTPRPGSASTPAFATFSHETRQIMQ